MEKKTLKHVTDRMGKFMIDKDKDNYKVLFSGATISEKEENKVGIVLIPEHGVKCLVN